VSTSGEIALETAVAIRFLNGGIAIVERVPARPKIILPTFSQAHRDRSAIEQILRKYAISERFEPLCF
jgi:hypothetical protein